MPDDSQDLDELKQALERCLRKEDPSMAAAVSILACDKATEAMAQEVVEYASRSVRTLDALVAAATIRVDVESLPDHRALRHRPLARLVGEHHSNLRALANAVPFTDPEGWAGIVEGISRRGDLEAMLDAISAADVDSVRVGRDVLTDLLAHPEATVATRQRIFSLLADAVCSEEDDPVIPEERRRPWTQRG